MIDTSRPHPWSATGLANSAPLGREVGARRLHVVAQQVELVDPAPVGGMDGDLGRRHLENEPAVTGVDRCEIEDVTEEMPVRVCIPAVDDDVRPVDHPPTLSEGFAGQRTTEGGCLGSYTEGPDPTCVRCSAQPEAPAHVTPAEPHPVLIG
jgi:hypothetical protein